MTNNIFAGRMPGESFSDWITRLGLVQTQEIEMSSSGSKPIQQKRQKRNYNRTVRDYFGLGTTTGEIGLEIECEGENLFTNPIKYWALHEDHSLRAVEGEEGAVHPPWEYVLHSPLPREEIPSALSYLTSKFKSSNSKIVYSPRTSVHVHVNCQELTIKQVYNYICMYLIFEELLVNYSGDDRVGNLFCLRGKDAEYFVNCLEMAARADQYNGDVTSDNMRYAACNSASLRKFGSLEFRSMRGTVDQQTIQNWVDILLRIKDRAMNYDNPAEIANHFRSVGPAQFFLSVFEGDLIEILSQFSGTEQSIKDCFRLMRDVAYAVKWEKPQLVDIPADQASFNDGYHISSWSAVGWNRARDRLTVRHRESRAVREITVDQAARGGFI